MRYFHGIRLGGSHRHNLSIVYPHDLSIQENDILTLDSMLGKLSEWLRMAGLSIVFSPRFRDQELLENESILVTRDLELFLRRISLSRRTVLLCPSQIDNQLSLMLDIVNIRFTYFPVPRYCTICGGTLREVDIYEVRDRVPPHVAARFSRVFVCEKCGKVYWKGSHHLRISERFKRAFELRKLIDRVIICVRGRTCMVRILNI